MLLLLCVKGENGVSGRFRGDQWHDKKVHGRTMYALQARGVRLPAGENPRKQAEYKAEFRRQTVLFRQEREQRRAERKQQAQRAGLQGESTENQEAGGSVTGQ